MTRAWVQVHGSLTLLTYHIDVFPSPVLRCTAHPGPGLVKRSWCGNLVQKNLQTILISNQHKGTSPHSKNNSTWGIIMPYRNHWITMIMMMKRRVSSLSTQTSVTKIIKSGCNKIMYRFRTQPKKLLFTHCIDAIGLVFGQNQNQLIISFNLWDECAWILH